ncbi:MAG: metal ABC transporter permease [Acidimicrobiales bacterium]|jgi:zinc/manganese transport system permease protein
MGWFFEPGLFSSAPVRTALIVGAVVAVVSAIVGVFTVLRGQSFAGHSLADVSTAGGSGALLLGLSPLTGFLWGGILGALAMDLIGVQRVRGRDVATGIVLGAATGLAALFLYLDTTTQAITGATQQILFGSIFSVDASTVPVVVVCGLLALCLIAFIFRPLLLSSLSPEAAAARGVRVRLVGSLFMVALAAAVALSALAIGAILSTALLIGPAASSLRLTRRFGWSIALAAVLGVATTWLGIVLAYDSYYWSSSRTGLPVSFFIVSLVVLVYLASGLPALRARSVRAGA